MGLFDTFIDKKKEIQLKNFGCILKTYSVGDRVPMRKNGYPATANFYCWANPKEGFVVVIKHVFVGIRKKPAKGKIFDCSGEEVGVGK
jgi:hypothetical protein